MTDNSKGYDPAGDPRTGRPPLPIDVERSRHKKTVEPEENDTAAAKEGSQATAGNPETPDKAGAVRNAGNTKPDEAEEGVDATLINEEMRNQDS